MPWESAQNFVGRALAAYPTVHPVVEQFRAVGVSRPVELTDANDRTFVLAVIDAWATQMTIHLQSIAAGGQGRRRAEPPGPWLARSS